MSNHHCIIGRHWRLNPEEGSAWLVEYTRDNDKVNRPDIIEKYPYCPLCGKDNKVNPKHNKILKGDHS